LPELAISVSSKGIAPRFPGLAARHLFVVHLDTGEAATEGREIPGAYGCAGDPQQLPSSEPGEVAPGLKVYFLARLQGLAERKGPPAGAGNPIMKFCLGRAGGGHFLGTLRSARAFENF